MSTAGKIAKALLGAVLVLGLGLVAGSVVFGVPVDISETGGIADTDSADSPGGPDAEGAAGSNQDGSDSDTGGGDPSDPASNPRAVTVSVSYSDGVTRNYTSVLRESFEFWEAEDRNPDDIDFVYIDDPEESDIHIAFTGIIEECRGDRSGGTFYFCSVDTDSEGSRVRVAGVYEPDDMKHLLRNLVGQYAGHESPSEFEGVTDLSTARFEFLDPWPTEEAVTVNLSVQGGADREWDALVREGIDYWQANQDRYGTYTQALSFEPDAAAAEITVSIVEDITECGIHDDPDANPLGCAERYNRSLLADETVRVQIEAGWDDRTTIQTVKHEFGHVYGVTHGEEPMPIMNASYADARTVPEPNVSERANPFGGDSIDVYVAYGSFGAADDRVRAQVQHAIDYYDEGAEGHVSRDVAIQLTDVRAAADIVIREGSTTGCSGDGGAGSCGRIHKNTTDSDLAWEFYTHQNITLRGIDTEAMGWHVGYWMGFSVATADSQSELPPPFRESDYDHVRNWWTQDP